MLASRSFLCLATFFIATIGLVQAGDDCDCEYLAQIPETRVDLSSAAQRNWTAFTQILASEVQAADQGQIMQEGGFVLRNALVHWGGGLVQGWDVVFYGDSITEDYRGTCIGAPIDRAHGSPAVFQKYFSQYNTGIMAVAGDQIDNLLYRLENGETPKKDPKVAVMLIGTNDFGAIDMCFGNDTDLLEAAANADRRYSDLVAYMRYNMPTTQIILVAVLPRAGWTLPDKWGYPNRFSRPINRLNEYIQDLANKDSMLHYIDCSSSYINSTAIIESVMPDGLHPNRVGMEMLAQCYVPLIARLVAAAPPANATAAQIPTPPINPCSSSWNSAPSSADGSAEGSAEGDVDPSVADTSPGAGASSPPAASPPPAEGLGGLLRDLFTGRREATMARADAMAERQRTILGSAPDPDCLLC